MTREFHEQGLLAGLRPTGHSELPARRSHKILKVSSCSMLELLFYITLGFRRALFASPGTPCYAADSFLTFKDLRFFSASHKSYWDC